MKNKLAVTSLLLVIALAAASIGYSCASFRASASNKPHLFMCPCGQVYIIDVHDGKVDIIKITPPGQNKQEEEGETDTWA